jgi:hypothetical protein
MKFKKYGSPWYFAIKGALFLLISAISFIHFPGSFKALGYLSSAFILTMAFAVFGNTFISKSTKVKAVSIILALCHFAFAIIIFVLTIKRGTTFDLTEQAEFRALALLWLRNWFAFFLLTEWIEIVHLWIKKNAHCITIFMDSIMTAIFLVIFAYLKRCAETGRIVDFYDIPFLFLATITLLAGLGTIATALMLDIGNKHSHYQDDVTD